MLTMEKQSISSGTHKTKPRQACSRVTEWTVLPATNGSCPRKVLSVFCSSCFPLFSVSRLSRLTHEPASKKVERRNHRSFHLRETRKSRSLKIDRHRCTFVPKMRKKNFLFPLKTRPLTKMTSNNSSNLQKNAKR